MLKFLSSIRLAVILIAAIVGLSVAATLYDMPEIFGSLPFRICMGLFFVNLFLCSAQLWPGLVRTLGRRPREVQTQALNPSRLETGDFQVVLADQGFRVQEEDLPEGRYLLAYKGRLALLAPHVLHIGLLIVIIGAFFTTQQTEGQLSLGPGQSHPLPPAIAQHTGPGILTVDTFETQYDAQGAISNWVTTFDITWENRPAEIAETTRVNQPYQRKGLSIYQMAYSNHHIITLTGAEEIAGSYALPESQRFPIGDESFMLYPMSPEVALLRIYDAEDEEIHQQALYPGSSYQFLDGTALQYEEPYAYTVLQLKYNPATPLVFTGFTIAVLASLMLLTGRYQEVRAFIPPGGGPSARVFSKQKDTRTHLKQILGLVAEEKE